jgi:hypothetical protein
MKKLLNLTAFLLILAGVFSACKKPDDTKIDYPINVPFTEYALHETSCQWKNLPYDEKVILINSNEVLENYLSFTEKSYPAIDFSKKSLLLISGKTTAGIDKISKTITQLSAEHFKLDLEIELAATPAEEWGVALVTSKIDDKSFVESHVTYKESIYPIDIPFEKLECNCSWMIDQKSDTLLIINSLEELEANAICSDSAYLEIDFSKYTVWVVNGVSPNYYSFFDVEIQQISSKKYKLDIDIIQDGPCTPSPWRLQLITKKIAENSEIEYNVFY